MLSQITVRKLHGEHCFHDVPLLVLSIFSTILFEEGTMANSWFYFIILKKNLENSKEKEILIAQWEFSILQLFFEFGPSEERNDLWKIVEYYNFQL